MFDHALTPTLRQFWNMESPESPEYYHQKAFHGPLPDMYVLTNQLYDKLCDK